MSEQIAQRDPARAARSALWRNAFRTFGASVLMIVLSVASSIVVARTLGPAGKGGYDLTIATANLLSIFLGLALPAGLTYVLAQGTLPSRRLLALLAGAALAQGLLGALALLAAERWGFADVFLPPEQRLLSILTVALLLVAITVAGYGRAMLVGRQLIARVNLADVLTQGLLFALILGAVGLARWRGAPVAVPTLLGVNLAVVAVSGALFLRLLAPEYRAAAPAASGRAIVAYALPCYAANLLQFLNYRLGLFIINLLIGVAAVGLYTLAMSLAQFLWLFSTAMATVLLPNIAASPQHQAENAARAAQAARLILWVSAAAGLLLGLAAPAVVPFVYGERFSASVAPLLWALPGVVLLSMANVLTAFVAGIGKPRINLMVSFLGLCATVPLTLLLVPPLGIAGAAMAASASYAVSTAAIIWAFVRETGLPLRALLLLSAEDRLLLRGLVARFARRRGRP